MLNEKNVTEKNIHLKLSKSLDIINLPVINSNYLSKKKLLSKPNISLNLRDEINFVKKLDLDVDIPILIAHEKELKNKKQYIDSNPVVLSKRLNTYFIKNPKQEQLEILQNNESEKKKNKDFKDLLTYYNNKKNEIKNLDEIINKLDEENYHYDLEIEVIDNYDKYVNNLSVVSNSSSLYSNKKKFLKTNNNLVNKLELKRKREIKKEEILSNKKENIIYLNNLKEKKFILKNEIKKIKTFINQKKIELNDEYHLSLYEGIDFRNEGLVNFIRNIWNIGMNVDINFFPTYLDNSSIDFLFKKAYSLIEITKLRNFINESKLNFINEFKDSYNYEKEDNKNDDVDFFPTKLNDINYKNGTILDLYPKTKKFMYNYEKKNLQDEIIVKLNNVDKFYSKIKLSNDIIERYNQIEKFKIKLMKLENKLEQDEKIEIMRISKKFIENDYGNKHKVAIETYIGAICGEEKKDENLLVYSKILKNNFDNYKKIQFYSTYKNEN